MEPNKARADERRVSFGDSDNRNCHKDAVMDAVSVIEVTRIGGGGRGWAPIQSGPGIQSSLRHRPHSMTTVERQRFSDKPRERTRTFGEHRNRARALMIHRR